MVSSFTFVSKASGYGEPILYVGWTLEYEMLFYMLFSLGLLFSNNVIAFFAPIFLLIGLVLLGFTGLLVLEFVLGMICAKLYLSKKFNYLGYFSLIIGMLFLPINIFYDLGMDRFYIYGIPAFFIVFGLINIKQTHNRLLVYLGDASYSIYLVQVFTIPSFYKVSSIFLVKLQNDVLSLLALIFTTIIGCLLYSLIEKKIGLAINSFMKNKHNAPVGIVKYDKYH